MHCPAVQQSIVRACYKERLWMVAATTSKLDLVVLLVRQPSQSIDHHPNLLPSPIILNAHYTWSLLAREGLSTN